MTSKMKPHEVRNLFQEKEATNRAAMASKLSKEESQKAAILFRQQQLKKQKGEVAYVFLYCVFVMAILFVTYILGMEDGADLRESMKNKTIQIKCLKIKE